MSSCALDTCIKSKDIEIRNKLKTLTLPVLSVEQYRVENIMYTIPIINKRKESKSFLL